MTRGVITKEDVGSYHIEDQQAANYPQLAIYQKAAKTNIDLVVPNSPMVDFKKTLNRQTATITPTDNYKEQVIKYIPGEVVATFLAIDSIAKSVPDFSERLYLIILGILFIATPAYIWFYTKEESSKQFNKISQMIIGPIAFVIWVLAIGGPFLQFDWYKPYIGGIMLPMFTFLAPVIASLISSIVKRIDPK